MNLLDLVFPKNCVSCGKDGSYFCSSCITLILPAELICPICAKPSLGGMTHPLCQEKFGLDGLWSFGLYRPPLKLAIQKLKYKWIKELAQNLNSIIFDSGQPDTKALFNQIKKDPGTWLVTSIPLHWQRQNWRGFNQAQLLGKLLAQRLGIKYLEALKKIKATKPQVSLSRDRRDQNLKNAFIIVNKEQLSAQNYLLVDDVWTTGATIKECCRLLKRSGAKKVWGLTLAR